MYTIKRKLLCYVILVSIVPLIIISSLYYAQTTDSFKKKSNEITKEAFEEIDNNFLVKSNRVQHIAELIITNEALCDVIRQLDYDDHSGEIKGATDELDVFFERFILNEDEIKGVLLYLDSGGVYEYNCNMKDKSLISFSMQYGGVNEEYGNVNWFDLSYKGYQFGVEGDIMAGIALQDLYNSKENDILATMYLILEDSGIGGIDTGEDEALASIMVYDGNGNFVTSRGKQPLNSIRKIPMDAAKKMFSADEGDLKIDIDGEKYYCCYYKSPVTGWRFIRTEPYYDYFSDFYALQTLIIILILAVLILIIVFNEFFVKTITTPLKNLISSIKEVENENFQVVVPVTSKDEFGFLCEKFNFMVKRVDELVSKVISEERKRKDTEIMSMQYQIRPHFIYNTLSSIRLYAYLKGEEEISEMLSTMGRFLRNTIHNVGRMITVDEEIKNINDYIDLYKIRYNNGFKYQCLKEANVGECKIPSMMIQPIIENSFFHGLNTKIDGVYEAKVTLSVYECEKGICISVIDNGIGIKEEDLDKICQGKCNDNIERLHIGIANTEKRIRGMFGEEFGISIKSEYGSYTQVDIILPKIIDETGYEISEG